MRAVLVYNDKSGSGMELSDVSNHFKQADIDLIKSIPLRDSLKEDLSSYIDQSHIIIAVYGGDGTQSAVANVLAGTKGIMAPLPGGTLNHFTKDLGIDQDISNAISNLKKSVPHKIDLASVNNKIFVNNSSLGIYPASLKVRDKLQHKLNSKWAAALVASIASFMKSRTYKLSINDEDVSSSFVFIGNNDYRLEKSLTGERHRLDQGILSVYAVKSSSRHRLFMAAITVLFGGQPSPNDIKIWKTNSLTIKSKKSVIRISRDGEHETVSTPLTYQIRKKSLTVLGGTSA